MVQRQAVDLGVTTVSIPGGSITDLVSSYLSAQTSHPVAIQELVLVVPSESLALIVNMPVVTRLDVIARDAAVRALTSDLRNAVDLISGQAPTQGASGRPEPGILGGVTTSKPHVISLYTWHAAPRQSALGAAALAVFQSLTRAFMDDRCVRVCTQLEIVTLNQAQSTIAAEWDAKLSTTYLTTTDGVERWTDAAFTFFAAVVGGSVVHNWRIALDTAAEASVMTVVGKGVPVTSTSAHVLRRAVHSTSIARPPRPGWDTAFVTPEQVARFTYLVENSWRWHPTYAGVFRESPQTPPSSDFRLLALALAQPPDTSKAPSTWTLNPVSADFGFEDYAAVRAVTVAYLQTVRDLTPETIGGGNIVLRAMLETEGFKGDPDGRGLQGRLARICNLDTAAYILVRRATNCSGEMAKYPTEVHEIWRLFASPVISPDFDLAATHTEAVMADDLEDEHQMHAKHNATLATQQGVHALRVAKGITG
jgi:hypothetical protein